MDPICRSDRNHSFRWYLSQSIYETIYISVRIQDSSQDYPNSERNLKEGSQNSWSNLYTQRALKKNRRLYLCKHINIGRYEKRPVYYFIIYKYGYTFSPLPYPLDSKINQNLIQLDDNNRSHPQTHHETQTPDTKYQISWKISFISRSALVQVSIQLPRSTQYTKSKWDRSMVQESCF